jgi:hypothetical protein
MRSGVRADHGRGTTGWRLSTSVPPGFYDISFARRCPLSRSQVLTRIFRPRKMCQIDSFPARQEVTTFAADPSVCDDVLAGGVDGAPICPATHPPERAERSTVPCHLGPKVRSA